MPPGYKPSVKMNHQRRPFGGFLGGKVVKNMPASAEDGARDMVSIPGSGRSLEKEMATHSSVLTWEIPQTEEPGGPQSMGSESQIQLSN